MTTNWWKEERGRAHLRRLQPGQPRPHDGGRLQPARPADRDGRDAGDLGRAGRRGPRGVHDPVGAASASPTPATRGPASSDRPGRIDTLLEWWQRDLDSGLGELPFPPDFPKMPGEPPRVQPSRKNPENWTDDGQASLIRSRGQRPRFGASTGFGCELSRGRIRIQLAGAAGSDARHRSLQHGADVVRRHRLELLVRARRGVPVGPPALELHRVAEAAALELVVAHLEHALRAQLDERGIPVRPRRSGTSRPRR